MKKSDQKKLVKTGEKVFSSLTRTQQIIVLVVIVLGFAGYFIFSQTGAHLPFSQEKVIKASNSEELLKLKWNGSNTYYVTLNGGKSTFSAADLTQDSDQDDWLKFSPLDRLGRANQANARLSYQRYMQVKTMVRPRIPNNPAGWAYNGRSNNQQIFFDNGQVTLYNRSHLVAWMFSGDAGSKENLVTGTRAMNSPGMQDFETQISDVLFYKKLHVRYQVTPVYQGDELLPRGVQMMAKSIEDDGKAYDLNVYVFNVQPGYQIDYLTGVGTKNK
ncbi:MAG: DNA/RNA non-specific endonuclease [Pseudolactococcus raffinolactis]